MAKKRIMSLSTRDRRAEGLLLPAEFRKVAKRRRELKVATDGAGVAHPVEGFERDTYVRLKKRAGTLFVRAIELGFFTKLKGLAALRKWYFDDAPHPDRDRKYWDRHPYGLFADVAGLSKQGVRSEPSEDGTARQKVLVFDDESVLPREYPVHLPRDLFECQQSMVSSDPVELELFKDEHERLRADRFATACEILANIIDQEMTAETGEQILPAGISRREERRGEDNLWSVLVAMYELGAVSKESRSRRARIAKSARGFHNVDLVKNELSWLKRNEFTNSVPGRSGGCWLLKRGITKAKQLSIPNTSK